MRFFYYLYEQSKSINKMEGFFFTILSYCCAHFFTLLLLTHHKSNSPAHVWPISAETVYIYPAPGDVRVAVMVFLMWSFSESEFVYIWRHFCDFGKNLPLHFFLLFLHSLELGDLWIFLKKRLNFSNWFLDYFLHNLFFQTLKVVSVVILFPRINACKIIIFSKFVTFLFSCFWIISTFNIQISNLSGFNFHNWIMPCPLFFFF